MLVGKCKELDDCLIVLVCIVAKLLEKYCTALKTTTTASTKQQLLEARASLELSLKKVMIK